MTGGSPAFKRIVLELHRNGQDPATLRLAAELAEFMHLDLFGRFVDDPGFARLACLPFAREFRVLEREWHAFAGEEAARARELAIAAAGRLFAEAARSSTVSSRFEVVRDSDAVLDAAGNRVEDIVVVCQKPHEGETFSHLLDTAFARAAAVLIMPSRVTRRRGPVVAVAGYPDDPSIETAAGLAAAAGEALLLLDAPTGSLSQIEAEAPSAVGLDQTQGGWPTYQRTRRHALGASNERLIVLSRGVLADTALSLVASRRGVPILVLRPDPSPARQ